MQIARADADRFVDAVETLRRFRRADIRDENDKNISDELYVDIYKDLRLIKEFKRSNTAFLVGRRGTGKSTVFQRAQSDFQKDSKTVTAYIDLKQVYEQSNSPAVRPTGPNVTFGQKALWSEAFLTLLIDGLIEQIAEKAGTSIFRQLFIRGLSKEQAIKDVKDVFARSKYIVPRNVAESEETAFERRSADKTSRAASVQAQVSPVPGGKATSTVARESEQALSLQGTERVIKIFNFKTFLSDLRKALGKHGIKNVIVFLDDYSELDRDDQIVLMDNVIYPLETAGDEFVKFKIAAYPGKYYIGRLDPQKIDQFYLDIAAAYSSSDVNDLDRAAGDYAARILGTRVWKFCNKPIDHFFDMPPEQIGEQLYYVSFCNPRAMGYILDYCAMDRLSNGLPINLSSLKDGARKYFENKVEAQVRHLQELRLSNFQKESLEAADEIAKAIVLESRNKKNNRKEKILSYVDKATIPTSHFHVSEDCDVTLLELQHLQYINFYATLKNKDGSKVSVYALTYGLCEQNAIQYGKPGRENIYRNYYVERVFDYSSVVKKALDNVEMFVCDACPETFPVEREEAFSVYKFRCPSCGSGTLEKRHIAGDSKGKKSKHESLLDPQELEFLQALFSSRNNRLMAKDIAGELDISPHSAGKLGKVLSEKALVIRRRKNTTYAYSIADSVARRYFGAAHPAGEGVVK